jgi:starvation-inducible DNA-binding protein
MHKTRIDIPAKKRSPVIKLLNDRLCDLIMLGRHAKQAHWNVKGPSFIALHELFDALAGVIDEHIDTTAERITALGGVAEGTITAVAKRTQLAEYPLDLDSGLDHVDAMATSVAAAAKLTREAIDESDKRGDKDTADLFTGTSRELDKQLWFLEAHLQAPR